MAMASLRSMRSPSQAATTPPNSPASPVTVIPVPVACSSMPICSPIWATKVQTAPWPTSKTKRSRATRPPPGCGWAPPTGSALPPEPCRRARRQQPQEHRRHRQTRRPASSRKPPLEPKGTIANGIALGSKDQSRFDPTVATAKARSGIPRRGHRRGARSADESAAHADEPARQQQALVTSREGRPRNSRHRTAQRRRWPRRCASTAPVVRPRAGSSDRMPAFSSEKSQPTASSPRP